VKSVRKSNASRLTLATLATVAGLSAVGVFAPSDAAAQVAPTSAQCNSSAFARANPALTAAADANFTQSTCRASCDAVVNFDVNKCDSDDFYASICGHIEAAKLRSVSPVVQAMARCKATIQARAAGTPTAIAARALPNSRALGPDQAIAVAPNESASGASANAIGNRRLMNYGRNHKTTASMTSSLAGRNAVLSAEKSLKHAPNTPAPVSAAHVRWTNQAQAANLAIESCEEYAWARSYTFSLVEDMLAAKGANPVAQAAALYASVNNQPADTAILARAIVDGTQEVVDIGGSPYRSADGSPVAFGGLLTGRRPKNELVGLSVSTVPLFALQEGGPNLRPELLQPSGLINPARPIARVSAIGISDPTLLDAMAAVRDMTYDNSAAANRTWVNQTVSVAGDAEFRARLLKMKRNILSLVNERSAVVEEYERGLRSHLQSCSFQNPIDEVPVEANLNPLWDPTTVMRGPAEELLLKSELLRTDPAHIDAGTIAPRAMRCVPGLVVWGVVDYLAWLDRAEGRAFTGGIAKRLIALDIAIEAELQRARAAGCFATDRVLNQCDWDAESFMVEARKVIGIDRSADYGLCVDALGSANFLNPDTGVPVAGSSIATNNASGFAYHRTNADCSQDQALTTVSVQTELDDGSFTVTKDFDCTSKNGVGYAESPKMLRTMLRCEAALAQAMQDAAAQLRACGEASAEALDEAGIGWNADSNTISERGNRNGSFGDGFDEGSDLFGASMQFTNAWSISGLGANNDAAHLNSACSLRPSMTNTFNAKASVFGSSFTLANAVTSVRVTDAQTTSLGNSSVIVMGQEFVTTPISAAANTYNIVAADAVAGPYDLISLSMTFAVGFVPLTVAAGATGQLGVDYRFGDDGAASCDGGDFSVSNSLRPHAKVDAYASASINLAIVEAGIKGVVNLIDLSLPLGGTLSAEGGLLAVDNAVRQTLTALSGYLAAFVEVDFWVDSVYFEVPLFSWEGIKSVETLHRDGVSGITIPGLRVL
jgi:hypothetical protein